MDTTFAWMIGGGLRSGDRDQDARTRTHLIALRNAQRDASGETSTLTRLAGWFGYQPVRATADPVSLCCAPA